MLRPEEGPFPFKCKSQPQGSGNTVGPAVLGTQPGGTEGRRRSSHRSVFPCRCGAAPEPVEQMGFRSTRRITPSCHRQGPRGQRSSVGAEIRWGGFRDVGSLLQSLPWLRESGVLPCSTGAEILFSAALGENAEE